MTGSVAVRGAGVVCALGVGITAVASAVAGGAEFAGFKGPSPSQAAYPAPFDARRDLPRDLGRRLGRQLAMSLSAVLEAVGTGSPWSAAPDDTGIFGATGHGPIDETVDFVAGVRRDGPRYASPLLFSSALHSAMAAVVARVLGVRGPTMVMSNGDVSFETALLVAVAALRSGRTKRAIVVGADAFHPLYARSLSQFGLVSESPDPVDPAMRRTMRGLHLGEGAGALVLEWDESGGAGVCVDDVRLGAGVPRRDLACARIALMSTGDAASARRHSDALADCGIDGAAVEYPAARFGAFSSLSAVAIAVEAATRLRRRDDPSPTVFIAAPHGASAATVVLAGCGSV